jgi:uncharacterized protein (TIGR03545 family)
MQILRLTYVVPRLLLLLVLLAIAEVGLGYATHWLIESAGQAAWGARVEVGSTKASLLQTRIQLESLVAANPQVALKNLIEAERIDIDFDSASLLRKKLIAPYGEITGIRFDTDRTTSGLLPESPPHDATEGKSSWLSDEAALYARNWLEGVEQRLSQDLRRDLQSIELAEQLAERWPEKYESLRARARQIKQDAKFLSDNAKIARQNPLRHIDFLTNLPNYAANLRRQVQELHTELASLPQLLASDREAIAAARVHDETLIRQRLAIDGIDADTLTNYLLGEQLAGPLQEAVAWLKWTRSTIPTNSRKIVAGNTQTRGKNIQFAGVTHRPDIWLQTLKVTGTANIGGLPTALKGTLRDVTSDPKIVGRPTVLEIESSGGLPLKVVASVDRTSQTSRDHVMIDCPEFPLPSMELGRRGPLGVSVSPTMARVNVSLTIVGDQLAGEVQFVQHGVILTPHIRNQRLRDEIEAPLADSLASIHQVATRISISGTLDRPRIKLWSNLGPAVAESTQQALRTIVHRRSGEVVADARAKVDAQIGRVEAHLASFQQQMAAELNAPSETIAQLLQQQVGGSLQEIGRLPAGSLFK